MEKTGLNIRNCIYAIYKLLNFINITVNTFVFLFNCNTVGLASGSMMDPASLLKLRSSGLCIRLNDGFKIKTSQFIWLRLDLVLSVGWSFGGSTGCFLILRYFTRVV